MTLIARSPNSEASSTRPELQRRHVLGLAAGFFGIGLLLNLSRFLLVFFYLPPNDAGLPSLVDDTTFLGVLNIVVLVVAAGRFIDAFVDPLIATRSDRSKRRIPMMTIATPIAVVATVLLFTTPDQTPTGLNIVWLIAVQAVMFVAITAYLTPAFALIRDLASGPERVRLSAVTGAAWSLGVLVAAMAPALVSLFESNGYDTLAAWRAAIVIVTVLAGAFMVAPQFTIAEPIRAPVRTGLHEAWRLLRSNPFLTPYLVADGAYFCGLMIVQTGLLYYATVLLGLERSSIGLMIVFLTLVSLPLFAVAPRAVARFGIRRLYLFAFAVALLGFGLIPMFGRLPGPGTAQALFVMAILAVPSAIIGGLSNGVLADIADASAGGGSSTAVFFAARSFVQKLSQTLGLVCFAMLTTFGRNVGDDLGIRLSGIVAIVMYLFAFAAFTRFDETALRMRLDRHPQG